MRYAAAAAKFFQINADNERDTVPLAPLLWANAYDAIDADQLGVTAGGMMTYKGKAMAGPAVDLPGVLNAPGFWLGSLISDGTTAFTIDPKSPPSALLSPFTYEGVVGIIGGNNRRFLDAITALLTGRLGPSKLLPQAEVDQVAELNRRCVLCTPGTAAELRVLYSYTFPSLPLVPVWGSDAVAQEATSVWGQVVGAFKDARKAYLEKSYDQAVQLAKAAAAKAELWDRVYAITKSVRDAPGTAVAAVAGAAVDTLKGNLGAIFSSGAVWWLLVIVGLVVAGAYTARRKGISFITGK